MRLRTVALLSVISASAAACGGGGDKDFDARPRIDSRPTPDSPPGVDCVLAPVYEVSLGSEATPAVFADGAFGQDDAGNWVVAVYGALNQLEPELGNHGISIYLIDNLGMFATNNFANPALGTPVTLDTGDACGGCLEGYGGQPTSMPPSMTNAPTQIYLADSGTLTMDVLDPVQDDPTALSNIAGTFTTVVMTGLDFNTGEPLVPACTTTVDMSFYFQASFSSAGAAIAPSAKWRHGVDPTKIPVVQATLR